jgi:hypothetical protein
MGLVLHGVLGSIIVACVYLALASATTISRLAVSAAVAWLAWVAMGAMLGLFTPRKNCGAEKAV